MEFSDEHNRIINEITEMGFDQQVVRYIAESVIRSGRSLNPDLLVNAVLEMPEDHQQHIKDGWFCIHSLAPIDCDKCNKSIDGKPLHGPGKPRPFPSALRLFKKHKGSPASVPPSPPPPPPRPRSATPPSKAAAEKKEEGVVDEDDGKCVICFVNERNSVFVPCGHIATCFECGSECFKKKDECPICQKKASMVIRTYRV